ncbi:S66 peptidase family protein [Olivibacter domesticus]|uniref:Muramoyltetrapeptide carboxypeptidase n=1 Tax=Olivibacter domesticus TaxID=407022 RepID=A0A1H7RXT5_OLID1|nr:LD-carboxypeptidase [Olivibacter domesticus]SEL64197.1 muramoyltetrapeptide carboxypeptidase [Olivibacter domesticus]
MTKTPAYLKKGDKVAIVCPAWKVDDNLQDAVNLLNSWGLEVVLGKTVNSSYRQYAGSDELRAEDFQVMLNDDSIKAIFAARGGYGCVRMIDQVDFTNFAVKPKWIIGFSDITVIHSHIHALYGVPTIHGQMPITIPDATKASLISLHDTLFGKKALYEYESESEQVVGQAQGVLIGGNLALLVNLLGSVSDMNYDGKILFVEDVGEFYYSVDRMLWTLKRAGKLSKLKGLIIGGFTNLKDNKIPFGMSMNELVKEIAGEYGYPIAFDFPAGHIDNNYTLILGKDVSLKVEKHKVVLTY